MRHALLSLRPPPEVSQLSEIDLRHALLSLPQPVEARPTIRDRLASRLGPRGRGQRGQGFEFGRNSDRMLVHENDASLSSDLLNQFQRESGESMASWSSLGQFR